MEQWMNELYELDENMLLVCLHLKILSDEQQIIDVVT
jgi:hypothetical protein